MSSQSCLFSIIALLLMLATTPIVGAQEPPAGDQLAELVAASSDGDFASFDDFLDRIAEGDAVPGLTQAREAQAAGTLKPDQLKLLARLLGVYNRVSNQTDALDVLAQLIAIETNKGRNIFCCL